MIDEFVRNLKRNFTLYTSFIENFIMFDIHDISKKEKRRFVFISRRKEINKEAEDDS